MCPRISTCGSVRVSVLCYCTYCAFYLSARFSSFFSCIFMENPFNNARYTAIRCVPSHHSLLRHSLPRPLPVTSSLPIPSPCHPPPLAISEVEKTRFRAFGKKQVTDRPTDGPTDPRTDRPTDGQTCGQTDGQMDRPTATQTLL